MGTKKSKKIKPKGAPPGTWREIILEGYCTYYLTKEEKESGYVKFNLNEKGELVIEGTNITLEDILTGKVKLPEEIPTKKVKNIYHKSREIPEYCENKISINCLGRDGIMCPFFHYQEGTLENLIEIYYGEEALKILEKFKHGK